MSLNQSFISDFSEYYRWSQRTKIKYKLQNQTSKTCFETYNKWPKWQDISADINIVSPGGCLPLSQGYIHV